MTRTRASLSFITAALMASQVMAAPTPRIIEADPEPVPKISQRSLLSDIGAAIVQAVEKTNGATQAAPAAAAAPAAPASAAAPPASAASPAPNTASSSSSPVDIDNTGSTLDSLLTTDVNKWLQYFGIGSGSSTTSSAPPQPAPASTATANTAPAYSWSPPSSSAPAYTPAPTTSTTSTSSSSTSQPTSSGVPSGDLYADISNSPGVDASFAKSILDKHNEYRADHGVGPLAWDAAAFEYAQNNANNYDCSGVLTHTHGQYGENLAAGYSDGPSAVTAWYDEGQTYNYQSANTYDHFTQVVWKGSTKVGCAYKNCKAENWGLYIICEYDPPGNIIGYNKMNVFPTN